MKRPALFVSSTCYDLQQVRSDIKLFAETLGLEPILSEYNSFPVNPDAGTLENCLNAVNKSADLFVLIVGSRYGSILAGDKSITNLEYLTARAKGIPVYVFVSRQILNILPVWKANPLLDFGTVTDSPKLFQFVSDLKDNGTNWVFGFDKAQDVFDVLHSQLAYLFMDALEIRRRFNTAGGLSPNFARYSGTVLRVLIERPSIWEYLLFSEALEFELRTLREQRLDWSHGIALGRAERVAPREFGSWVKVKLSEVSRLCGIATHIVNEALPVAFGPPGVAGDAGLILHAAARLAGVYKQLLEWKLDFLRLDLHPKMRNLNGITSRYCDTFVEDIERFSQEFHSQIYKAADAIKRGERAKVELMLTLRASGVTDQMAEEMGRVTELFESGEISLD